MIFIFSSEAISVDGGKYLELRFVAESNQVDDRN